MTTNGRHPIPPQPPGTAVQIPFAPLDLQASVQNADSPDGPRIVLVLQTAQGVNGYFFEARNASLLASMLEQAAIAARSGLTVIGDLGGMPAREPQPPASDEAP